VTIRDPIASPAAWRGAQISPTTDWLHPLTQIEVDEILRAVGAAKAAGKTAASLQRADFPLPTLAARVREWGAIIDRGLGFVLVRGFPTEQLGPDDAALGYVGLGLHLGTPVPQNVAGETLCHVRDHGVVRTGPSVRLYMTREKQDFHTDGADVIGLLCLRRARSGGLSRIVSSVSVFNEIVRRRPELVPVLFEPFWFKGEFAFPMSICNMHNGRLRTFYIGWYIRDAQADPEVPRLSPEQAELLTLIEDIANDPTFHLDMDFQVGDLQLLNNATILHARTAYEDFEEPGSHEIGRPRASRAITQHSSKSVRSCARPRCTRDFMPESEIPSISAACCCVSPSSSVSVRASRYGEGSSAMKGTTAAASFSSAVGPSLDSAPSHAPSGASPAANGWRASLRRCSAIALRATW
jgi:hypothetical protein